MTHPRSPLAPPVDYPLTPNHPLPLNQKKRTTFGALALKKTRHRPQPVTRVHIPWKSGVIMATLKFVSIAGPCSTPRRRPHRKAQRQARRARRMPPVLPKRTRPQEMQTHDATPHPRQPRWRRFQSMAGQSTAVSSPRPSRTPPPERSRWGLDAAVHCALSSGGRRRPVWPRLRVALSPCLRSRPCARMPTANNGLPTNTSST